ncbi:MAG TPA: 6-carboxytetrahydropterin synthase [Herpetosiphonaceae bacterium]|nr:6-carboxytetrahydropterin synthase [Herpetosiphonaceae bacterium]
MNNLYRLEVTKDELGFAAAHFITMRGKCERLHGHNYRVSVEVAGRLGEDGYVVDFGVLKKHAREIARSLDHRVLLAAENAQLAFSEADGHLQVQYGFKRYVFPLDEVIMLPIANTTAELLATWFCGQLSDRLRAEGVDTVASVGVWVSEGPGQQALARIDWEDSEVRT